ASKDYSISFARFVAMIFIVTCHIQQFYDNELCWWFNVGVQMFFFISGYLYSNRMISDSVGFVVKQFVKILVPYYICITITWGVASALHVGCGLKQLLHLVTINGTGGFSSLSHVWFIAYILMCYLITPMLFRMKIVSKNIKKSVMRTGLLLIGLLMFFEFFAQYYNAAWIICFVLGIILGEFEIVLPETIIKMWKVIIIVAAFFANAVKIFCQNIVHIEFMGFSRYSNYTHVLLGIALVIILMELYKIILNGKCVKMLDLSDKYSYFVYLAHHIFILGAFSLLNIIENPVIAIIEVVICTVVAAVLLHRISKMVNPIAQKMISWISVD
ncbi:acyltransferase family protein, partial [Frisingicoccus sp.]|uniref:acyltransferase family protein n=1 Tax=Frisingicoccus sp. TaxID=1918627 RepID=UPI003AB26E71